MYHLCTQGTDFLIPEVKVPDKEGAVGEIDDGAGKGFVEGGMGGSKAGQREAWAEGGREGGAEGEEGVFGCVVVVDWGREKYILARAGGVGRN